MAPSPRAALAAPQGNPGKDGAWVHQADAWSPRCPRTFSPASWASSRAFTRVTSFCVPPASMPAATAGVR